MTHTVIASLAARVTHPVRNRSESLRNAALMSTGNGYRSTNTGNLTMASHCSPTREERRPIAGEERERGRKREKECESGRG